MQDQPKFYPQRGTNFFPDGRSARSQVQGTVSRAQSAQDDYFSTGLVGGAEGDGLPLPLSPVLLERGMERYNIYCAPCHSRVGNGKGMIVARGYYPAANFHTYRLRRAPFGHFFSVITNGYGVMPSYAAELTPTDRWAVVAYIRALQLSQNAQPADLPAAVHAASLQQHAAEMGLPSGFMDVWLPAASTVPAAPSPQPVAPAAPAATESLNRATTTARSSPKTVAGAVQAGSPSAPAPSTQKSSDNGIAKKPSPNESTDADKPSAESAPSKKAAAGSDKAGQTVYLANCSMCHQPGRTGLPPMIPSLLGVVDRVGEARVRTVVKSGIPDGKPPMPAHPDMTEQQIDDLIAFLRTK